MKHISIVLSVLLLVTIAFLKAAEPMPAFVLGTRILFQGDFITDGNRGRNADPNHILGHGAALVDFQRIFDEAVKRAPADYWIWDDNMHPPTAATNSWPTSGNAWFASYGKVPGLHDGPAPRLPTATSRDYTKDHHLKSTFLQS